jgi:hypothetical protein
LSRARLTLGDRLYITIEALRFSFITVEAYIEN